MDKKEQIIEKLKNHGCRITKQRQIIIDIILENDCCCCKEIFYKASRMDEKIGIATVYRMMVALENIGVLNRDRAYKIECIEDCALQEDYEVVLDDHTKCRFSEADWKRIVQEGMKQCGCLTDQKVVVIRCPHKKI